MAIFEGFVDAGVTMICSPIFSAGPWILVGLPEGTGEVRIFLLAEVSGILIRTVWS